MGIPIICAEMLLHEHRYRPITGKLVTIARHSVDLSGSEMDRLLQAMDVPKRAAASYELDQDTVSKQGGRDTISDRSFFKAFSDAEILSLDVSAYENADIVLDLQDPVPPEYHGYADFVFDGGSLDNIFDPAAALRNISSMLKPGGRFFSMNTGGPNPAAYLKFSGDWFMDFCAINNYEDCRVYIANYPNSLGIPLSAQRKGGVYHQSPFETVVWSFNPYVEVSGQAGYDFSNIETQSRIHVYCIGEKGANSTDHRNPIQKHYRVDAEHKSTSVASARRFLGSQRPTFTNGAKFAVDSIPRIDSSPYPSMLTPVAIVDPAHLQSIGFGGSPAW